MTDHDNIRAALACIPPDVGHDERVRIAFAVFDGVGDTGADLWLDWAAQRSAPNAAEDRATWKSARKRGPVTVATLYGIAKDHGFKFDAAQAPAPKPSADELKARASARREAEQREQAATAERQRQAAAEAARLWGLASEEGASPYLERKGVRNHGGRFAADGALLLPMRDAAGELCNVQTIKPARPADGGPDKLFIKGARKTGTLHMIGTPEGAAWLLVAEGLATGASIHEATGRPVAVAWDAGNLVHVVRALRGRYPAARIAVCGDDDADTEARTGKNPGRLKATEAARAARGPAIFPAGLAAGASDFNDMHQAAGLDAVRELIEAALQAAESPAPSRTPDRAKKTAPAGRERAARGDADEGASGAPRFDAFRVDDDALWFDPPDDGSGGAARPVRVCGPLHVAALARDAHDEGAALLLEFDTPIRAGRQWLMPLAMLAGDGTAYRSELLSKAFMVPTDAKRRALLTSYLQSRRPAELVRLTDRVGWHETVYVLPRETLGDCGGERIRFHQPGVPVEANFQRRRTSAEWRERVGRYCEGNTRLTLAVCSSLAAPLLRWAEGTDAAGVHVWGFSSLGKSTGHAAAASVWGIGGDSKTPGTFIQEWKASDNGLEGLAAQHSDAALILDEFGRLDPKIAGEAMYQLSNGKGKQRAAQSGAARPRLTWRTLVYSAGEKNLREHMAGAGQVPNAGQELRFLEVPAEVAPGTMHENLHEHANGDAFALAIKAATVRTYGEVGREWLEWLVANAARLPQIVREQMEPFVQRHVKDDYSGQVKRAARCFALRAAAGELATAQGLTGWPPGWASEALSKCFAAWLESRSGGTGLSEDAQMLRRARLWFQAHGLSARFPDFERRDDDHAPQAINQAGWRRRVKTTHGLVETVAHEWFVFPEVFKAELCGGGIDKPILRLLDSLGHVHREKRDGFTCGLPVDSGPRQRVYRIKGSILGEHDE